MLTIYKVSGDSMSPEIKDESYAIGSSFFFKKNLKVNDIIIFHHQKYGPCIKKIKDICLDDQSLTVIGTHPNSTSSEKIGSISFKSIKSKVFYFTK